MIPLMRPTLPTLKSLESKLRDVLRTGMITDAKYVRKFEKLCAQYLGVKYVAAVSNGTSALILSLVSSDIKGEVIIPSFTYSSGGHVLLWSGLRPVFADIDKETFNISPDSIESRITPRTSAIMPTHVFGNPCNIDKIEKIAKKHHLKVIYDAAHAFGSLYKNKSVMNFGDVSMVSLTPTKVLTTGEGGLIIGNKEFIKKVLQGKLNGDSFNRQEEFLGFTARMSEFNAILGIEALKILPRATKRRLKLVELYQKELKNVSGISFQRIEPNSFSVYRDFVILVDKEKFGISRDVLLQELLKRKIESKVYFYPLHKKKMYKEYPSAHLTNTEFVSERIMNLPLYSHMPELHVRKVCSIIKAINQKHI